MNRTRCALTCRLWLPSHVAQKRDISPRFVARRVNVCILKVSSSVDNLEKRLERAMVLLKKVIIFPCWIPVN